MAKNESNEEPQTPNPWEILNKLSDALTSAKQAAQSTGSEELMVRLTSALERVSAAQLQGAELIASETRRAHRPSNEVTPRISVFNRRGVLLPPGVDGPTKPPLRCVMMIPWLVEWESCTREEVELLNLLEQGEYRLTLSDKSKVMIGVKIDYKLDGITPGRLILNSLSQDGSPGTAFNKDNFRNVLPLPDMLRQLLRRHKPEVAARAASIMSDEEEEALIEAGQLVVSK